jgi:succinate-semialdehyde dehydrogenase/glutarate-semialdehyde dehydrogenase
MMSRYAVTNPATNEVEESYESSTDADVAQALDAAQNAYATWGRKSTPAERAALLTRVADLYMERKDELAEIINHEMGKTIEESLVEVEFSSAIYRYYADNGPEFLQDAHIEREAAGSAMLRKEPIGVLLGVMPWNYPYYQVARFAGPNLMLGNTIVLKHAALCPKSSAAMERIFLDAGFPAGAYTNLYASFDQVSTIIADPRVRGVSLTGSERAGVQIAREAGENLKKVVCELGGSDPFVLLSTDDMDATVQLAIGGRFENSGQVCNGAKRFIVIDALYDEFLKRFAAATSSVKLAPLCSVQAAEHLSQQVHAALEQGAVLTLGSPDNSGAYFEPTILTDIPADADARHEEFFGPVAQFYRVASEEEAIALANDTPFGLGSYVFTTDPEQGVRVADALETGMTYVNEVGADSAELPFGGVKRSGFGRELGPLGMGEFVNMKLISIDKPGLF